MQEVQGCLESPLQLKRLLQLLHRLDVCCRHQRLVQVQYEANALALHQLTSCEEMYLVHQETQESQALLCAASLPVRAFRKAACWACKADRAKQACYEVLAVLHLTQARWPCCTRLQQRQVFFEKTGCPHLWLWG